VQIVFYHANKDSQARFRHGLEGCFFAFAEDKVNPFTKFRQPGFFPSVSPHRNICFAVRWKAMAKPVDKACCLG
jgi:hypothetical protein